MDEPSTSQESSSSTNNRFSTEINYEALQAELFSNPATKWLKFKLGHNFVNEPVDITTPLDSCMVKNEWFCSGYIVRRKRMSGDFIYSQIVYIFPGRLGDYYASLIDLELRDPKLSPDTFDPQLFQPKELSQKLHEVRTLKVVYMAPVEKWYFNPTTIDLNSLKTLFIRQQMQIAEEERRSNESLTLPDCLIKNCYP